MICRFRPGKGERARVGMVRGDLLWDLGAVAGLGSLSELIHSADLCARLEGIEAKAGRGTPVADVELLAPIERQEVWGAGVTYKRSRAARMEESRTSASVYDLVYAAERPELFHKATPHRVVGPNGAIRIRRDARWNVPEPELTLVIAPDLRLVGYTIGNDVSSRDIEGENPLYLPQAKVYDGSASLGPGIVPAPDLEKGILESRIILDVRRGAEVVFSGETRVSEMRRSFAELIEFLGREATFPDGVFLMTGTGIIPESTFTLHPGDEVSITIDGIGTLTNTVTMRGG